MSFILTRTRINTNRHTHLYNAYRRKCLYIRTKIITTLNMNSHMGSPTIKHTVAGKLRYIYALNGSYTHMYLETKAYLQRTPVFKCTCTLKPIHQRLHPQKRLNTNLHTPLLTKSQKKHASIQIHTYSHV